jgi:hypothetical protein
LAAQESLSTLQMAWVHRLVRDVEHGPDRWSRALRISHCSDAPLFAPLVLTDSGTSSGVV